MYTDVCINSVESGMKIKIVHRKQNNDAIKVFGELKANSFPCFISFIFILFFFFFFIFCIYVCYAFMYRGFSSFIIKTPWLIFGLHHELNSSNARKPNQRSKVISAASNHLECWSLLFFLNLHVDIVAARVKLYGKVKLNLWV